MDQLLQIQIDGSCVTYTHTVVKCYIQASHCIDYQNQTALIFSIQSCPSYMSIPCHQRLQSHVQYGTAPSHPLHNCLTHFTSMLRYLLKLFTFFLYTNILLSSVSKAMLNNIHYM